MTSESKFAHQREGERAGKATTAHDWASTCADSVARRIALCIHRVQMRGQGSNNDFISSHLKKCRVPRKVMAMQIPTYDEFTLQITTALSDAGHTAKVDQGTLVVQLKGGNARALPLDTLYRTFVDVAIQNPSASVADVLAYVQGASNTFEQRMNRTPVFTVSQVPNLRVARVLMQGCISIN